MTEREAEKEIARAERMFARWVAWGKCLSTPPYLEGTYAYAHWRELEGRHMKDKLSREVKAA